MKILLVRPVSDTYIISPPIGLGYLATALRKEGFEPAILDCAREAYSLDDFRQFISSFQADMVGFQVWSCDVPQVAKSLQIVKHFQPEAITVPQRRHCRPSRP